VRGGWGRGTLTATMNMDSHVGASEGSMHVETVNYPCALKNKKICYICHIFYF